MLEKTLESPLDCKEIQLVNAKGNQSWIVIVRTDAESEPPVLWPPNLKYWFIGKDPDAGKHWRQEEQGLTEDKMVGWHHRINGHEFEWTLGVGDGQGGLACCDSWGHRVGHEWAAELNWTELKFCLALFLFMQHYSSKCWLIQMLGTELIYCCKKNLKCVNVLKLVL